MVPRVLSVLSTGVGYKNSLNVPQTWCKPLGIFTGISMFLKGKQFIRQDGGVD